jgi:hypothetical protein
MGIESRRGKFSIISLIHTLKFNTLMFFVVFLFTSFAIET